MIRVLAYVIPLFLTGCFSQPPAPTVDRSSVSPRSSAPPAPSGPGYYTVKRGDTLYRIALENGQDYKDLAAWNNLVNPSAIKEGQVLRVAPPGTLESAGAVVAKPVTAGGVVEARSLDQPSVATVPTAVSDGVKREPRVGKEPYSEEAYARLNRVSEIPRPVENKADAKPEAKPEVKSEASPSAPSGPDDVSWMWPSAGKLASPYSDAGNKGLDFSGKAGDPVLAAGEGKVVYAGAGLRGYGELVIIKHNATFLSAYAHNRKILVKEGQQVSRGQKIAEMGNTDADSVKLHFEIRKQGKPVDPAQYLPKR
ncbi:MAG: LysM peptidoglycan-binding domain-containing protein [Rhodocyclales bacterium GT-UBC]|nr:MAG: LysM peptidoglycan-binding domain-containing protein [Rhodocyclales bacterium GT-UBC]